MLCQQCKKKFPKEKLVEEKVHNSETEQDETFLWCFECKRKFEEDIILYAEEYLITQHQKKDTLSSYECIGENLNMYCLMDVII